MFELGALSGPDMGLIQGIAGNPDSFLDINEAKLRQLRKNLITGMSQKLQARGFESPAFAGGDAPAAAKGAPGKGSVPAPAPKQAPAGKVRVKRVSDGATGMMDANDPAVKSGKYEVI